MKPIQIFGAGVLSLATIGIPLALKARGANAVAEAGGADPCAGATGAPGSCGADTRAAGSAAPAARALPKLVELGTTTCAPCKAMLVVMDELEQSYGDQLVVEFINVQNQPEAAAPFAARVIPTQVFFGSDGRELFRHTGFYATDAIVAKWRELGFPLAPKAR